MGLHTERFRLTREPVYDIKVIRLTLVRVARH